MHVSNDFYEAHVVFSHTFAHLTELLRLFVSQLVEVIFTLIDFNLFYDVEVLDLAFSLLKLLPKLLLLVVLTLLVFFFLVDELLLLLTQVDESFFSDENFLVDVFQVLNLPLDQVLQSTTLVKLVV